MSYPPQEVQSVVFHSLLPCTIPVAVSRSVADQHFGVLIVFAPMGHQPRCKRSARQASQVPGLRRTSQYRCGRQIKCPQRNNVASPNLGFGGIATLQSVSTAVLLVVQKRRRSLST